MGNAPAPHELSPQGWAIASDYYASGYAAGLAEGWDRCERSYAEHHDVVRAILARLGEPFDVQAARRGQGDRAARQRQILAERGVNR